jgi:hypothetical protein
MDGAYGTLGAEEKRDSLLVRKPGGERSLEIRRGMWVDNIKVDTGEIAWGGVDWIDVAKDTDK